MACALITSVIDYTVVYLRGSSMLLVLALLALLGFTTGRLRCFTASSLRRTVVYLRGSSMLLVLALLALLLVAQGQILAPEELYAPGAHFTLLALLLGA